MSTHDFFLHVIHSLFILLLSGNLSSSKNINNFRFSTQSLQNAQFLFHHVRASLLVSCELTVYVIIIHHRCCCFCFWTELKVILTESFLPLLPHPAISFLSSLRVEIANINQNNGKSYAYRTRKEEEMFKIHFSFFHTCANLFVTVVHPPHQIIVKPQKSNEAASKLSITFGFYILLTNQYPTPNPSHLCLVTSYLTMWRYWKPAHVSRIFLSSSTD